MARFVDPTIIEGNKWNDLNDAAIRGLGQFLSDIGHRPANNAHRVRASEASTNLSNGVMGNVPPNYDDSYIAAAYMVEYHLNHCALAYWSFSGLFNGMNKLPRALYVCDVGAGTGAGLVGLSLALSDWPQKPIVYFDSVEPSDAMRKAGTLFWRAFSQIRGDTYNIIENSDSLKHFKSTPYELPELPDDAMRIVSAFHLSFPYDMTSTESRRVFQSCHESVASAVSLVVPHHGLFTVNRNKEDSLNRVVGDIGNWSSHAREIAPTDHQIHGRHTFFSRCATDFGFAPKYSRRGYYSRYTFPRDGVLLWTERTQAANQRRYEVRERQGSYSATAPSEEVESKRGQRTGCAVAVMIFALIAIIVVASMYIGF